LNISSFGEDEAGEIYVVGLGGTVQRIRAPQVQTPAPFAIRLAVIRRRSSGEALVPVTVKSNAKKYDLEVHEATSVPVPSSVGATILVNGTELNTTYTTTVPGTPIFVARLKRDMLAQPGALTIEVVRADGSRSNPLTIQVAAAEQ
jgi:hypothetical protein